MLIEHVNDARSHEMDLIRLRVLDRTRSRDAVDRLEVVPILHLEPGARMDRGDMEGEAHPIVLQEQPRAFPARRLDTSGC